MKRRQILVAFGLLALATPPSAAADRYRVVGVDVVPSALVSSRVRFDMASRIRARLASAGDGGRPVRVIVTLRTIDPYRADMRDRRIAATYSIVDARSSQTLDADRFTERATTRDDVEGTVAAFALPRSRAAQERELADKVAAHILRWAL